MKLRHVVTAAAISGAFAVIVTGPGAVATHEPADKAAATASDIDEVNDGVVLLEETMRVSSTSDLILQTTAECSILTSLYTEGGPTVESETDGAFGQVELWITVDGKRVPVSTDDENTDDPESEEDENSQGEVVFCNRAYQRTVTDNEEDENPLPIDNNNGDGIDSEDDFIRTRTANAFNWMAFNAGKEYDADGDNVVTVQLHGRFTREPKECETRDADNALEPYTDTCADAYVGSRSLIIEAVHASNHEAAAPVDDGAEEPSGDAIGSLLP